MALVFKDGFDHLSAADTVLKWDATSSTSGSVATGVYGFGSCRVLSIAGLVLQKTVPAAATYIVATHVRIPTLPGSDTAIVLFREGTTNHTDIRVTSTGALRATRNGTSLGVSSAVISANVWYWLSVKVNIHDSTGTVTVYVNGVSVLALTGQDTRNGGTAGTVDNIQLVSAANSHNWDNTHILDTSGGSPLNDQPTTEEWRIDTQVATGAGNSTQFTPSTGSNWQNVDDATEDGDSTYNESSTVGHTDLFAIGNFTAGVVREVQVCLLARKTDSGTREIREKCRSNSTNYSGSTQALTSAYALYRQNREVDPNTSAAWASAALDAAEFGYELVT